MKLTEERGKLPDLNLSLFPFTEDLICIISIVSLKNILSRVWGRGECGTRQASLSTFQHFSSLRKFLYLSFHIIKTKKKKAQSISESASTNMLANSLEKAR